MRAAVLAMLLFVAVAEPVAATLTRVTNLEVGVGRVTVDLDGPVTAKLLVLAKPQRIAVDLAGVDTSRLTATGGSIVTAARIGPFERDTARLVIDLARPMRVAAATLTGRRLTLKLVPTSLVDFIAVAKRGRVPLVIDGATPTLAEDTDVAGAAKTMPAARPRPGKTAAPPAGPAPSPAPAPVTASDFDLPDGIFGAKPKPPVARAVIVADAPATVTPAPPRSGGRRPLVVIDAGHGGKDAGAIALTGAYEKEVTLAIARVVARTLTASGKVRVKLTRDDDRFIPLGGRVAIARAARADLFVSIHADSAPNPQARGASVYTLSDTASDVVAARLAARENKADIIGGVNLGVEAPEVGDVMIALMRRSTLNNAIAFAETLQGELGDRIAFRGEFHHFAGFLVLKAPDIPSVLLESGYVSNADDAKLLFSKKGQLTIGEGIARAIEKRLTP